MLTRLRPGKPSPALVISCIALFVALSGTSYAVIKLPKNSVGTKQLRPNAVKSSKIADNQITGADVNEATLAEVPSAANAGSAANAAQAGNADNLDGLDSASFLQNGAVAGGSLAGNYPNPLIGANKVGAAELADNSVDLGAMLDNSVGSAELASNAAGSSEVVDGSLVATDVGLIAGLTVLDFPSISAGNCSSLNVDTAVTMEGDPTLVMVDDTFPNGLVVRAADAVQTDDLEFVACNVTGSAIDALSNNFFWVVFNRT